jgi:hypothetical protein
MEKGKITICVWHNCMGCLIKGLENYLTWFYRISENKEVVLLYEKGIENNRKSVKKLLRETDIFISSCSSFYPTDTWKENKDLLEKKRWYVVYKGCELEKTKEFRNTKTYKWLYKNNAVAHISANRIFNLNEKINELKNKPRLDT